MKDQKTTRLIIYNALSFLLMILVNVLANLLPINGVTTGEVSDAFPNLFAPAGFTFSIWSLIYILLAGFIINQLLLLRNEIPSSTAVVRGIGSYFIISALANAAWIISWHYQSISLSLILMAVILVSLIIIYRNIRTFRLNGAEKLFFRLPFSIYLGWITVATLANLTIFLVSVGWGAGGLAEQTSWTILVLLAGLAVGAAVSLKNKDIAYGLVIIWAYFGILFKHLSADGFAGAYPAVSITVSFSLLVMLTLILTSVFKKARA